MGYVADDVNAYVMGFFLALSILNVWENTDTFLTRRKKIDAVQWVSSFCQLANLTMHLVLNTSKNLDCDQATNAETILFYIMQLGSGFVIIYRATGVIDNIQRRQLARLGLALILAVSVGLNLASDIMRTMTVEDGTCTPLFKRELNDISKIVLAVLYAGLLIAFILPVVEKIKMIRTYVDTSVIKDVAVLAALKICFAIVIQILTVLLSIFGLFGDYFWVQFTLQNYSMIWASTVASRKGIVRQGSSDSSSTGSPPPRKSFSSGSTNCRNNSKTIQEVTNFV